MCDILFRWLRWPAAGRGATDGLKEKNAKTEKKKHILLIFPSRDGPEHNSVAVKDRALSNRRDGNTTRICNTLINNSCLTTADALGILSDMRCGAH